MSPKSPKKRPASPTATPPSQTPKKAQQPPISQLGSAADPPASPPDYIVDRLFRRQAISLLSGPPYAGKTTLMFQIIRDWSAGIPIFGYESFPAPCCYVSTIHTVQHAKDVMARVGVIDTKVISTVNDGNESRSFERVCDLAGRIVPELGVIFLDGIHPMCSGNPNDPGAVTESMANMNRLLSERRLTLIASGCSSKPKDHYSSPRDRFAGAYSWLQGSSAFVSVDFVQPENPSDGRRVVVVHSKSGAAEKLQYRFTHEGMLALVSGTATTDPFQRYENFDNILFAFPPGYVLTAQEIVEIGEQVGLSRSSVNRRLADLMSTGYIGKAKWGSYRIERSQ
jgi:hypothetical protein